MSYNPRGRGVLLITLMLCLVFRRSPWKRIFVYPFRTITGKMFFLQSALWIVAVVMTIVWSFDLSRVDGSIPMKQSSRHTLFLLDGSLSMSADDIMPNRFTKATDLMIQIASSDNDAGHGLIVFSGLPVIRIPWTQDTRGFSEVVQNMRLGDFPPTDNFLGTALGDALLLSLHQFNSLPLSSDRSIVVISDGDSNKGYDPYKVLSLLKEQNISVYFIALGDDGYEVGKDSTGLPVITSFDNELMQQFADQTKGKIYRNPDETSLSELIASLAGERKAEQHIVYLTKSVSLNDLLQPYFLSVFLLLTMFSLMRIIEFSRKR